jgi:hypothetical protein
MRLLADGKSPNLPTEPITMLLMQPTGHSPILAGHVGGFRACSI